MHRGRRALRAWLGLASAALLTVAFAAATPTVATAQPGGGSWPDRAEGFGSTATGGAGGQVVTVSNQADLEQAVSGTTPRVVKVDGTITLRPHGHEVPIGSNKTIIGVGTRGQIVAGGFRAINQRNIIIRNLTIRDGNVASDPCGNNNDFDGIQIDNSRDIWIDHNHLTNPGDGIMDLRKDIDNVTVSWNIISNGCKAFGIGWTPNVVTKISIHNNWLRDNRSRNPVIDNVVAGHIYNNYWLNVFGYGVLGRGAAKVVVEGNYFQDTNNPYGPDSGHPNAEVVARDNILVNVSGRQQTRGSAFDPSSYYSYQLDPASQVPDLVTTYAGPQPNIGVDDPQPTPPSIITHPAGQTATVGGSVTFSVAASGSQPLSYQWRHDGADIPGATAASYTISEVQEAHAGQYTVVVSNSERSVTSDPATLTVQEPPVGEPTQYEAEDGTVGGGTSIDSEHQPFTGTGYANFPSSGGWLQFDNVDGGVGGLAEVEIRFANGSGNARTGQLLVNGEGQAITTPATGAWNDWQTMTVSVPLNVGSGNTIRFESTGQDLANIDHIVVTPAGGQEPTAPTITTQPVSQTVAAGDPVTFTVEASGTEPLSYQWRHDGADIPGATGASYTIPSAQASDAGEYSVVVSNSAGSATSDPATLTMEVQPTPPMITTQPASQTVTAGDPVTFSVEASGTAPLGYQWQHDGADIPGATAVSYTIPSAQESDEGQYTVVVSNEAGSVTSDPATLTVQEPSVGEPTQYEAEDGTVGGGTSIDSEHQPFTGTGYANFPSSGGWLEFEVDGGSGGSAEVEIRFANGSGNARTGQLLVNGEGQAITTPATGAWNDWQTMTVSVPLTAGTGNTIRFETTGQDLANIDHIVVTANQQPTAPVITTHPASQTVATGETVTFSVEASGTPPLSYQWQHDGANIPGATGASHTVTNVQASDEGQYTVVVSNSVGSVTSDPAMLVIHEEPTGPIGWAAQPGKGLQTTTGGGDATPVEVRNVNELTAALSGSTPRVIHVVGSIQLSRTTYSVGSNKSIIGVGQGAELVGGGLHMNGVSNVIIRNLTIRDAYVPGDWGGNSNGTDLIRADNSHHIWIDHNLIQRGADGLIDLRPNSDFITLSWNIFADHNKTGFVSSNENDPQAKATIHHNWWRNLYQRALTHDNVLANHMYNNYYDGIMLYAMNSRTDRGGNHSAVVVENNYFRYTNDPLVVIHPTADLVHRGNIFGEGTTGFIESNGTAWEPRDHYSYQLDPPENVPALVTAKAGPEGGWPQAPSTITVALNGSGDFASVIHALGSIPPDQQTPVTIVVQPGTYFEVTRVWPERSNVTIRGATGNPNDVVITSEWGRDQAKFYHGTYGVDASPTLTVYADNVTLQDLTVRNTYGGSGPAIALRTLGDNITLTNVNIDGDHFTE